MQWAATISNENLRESQMETTARAWLKTDPRNASSWISNSSLPDDAKTRLLNPGGKDAHDASPMGRPFSVIVSENDRQPYAPRGAEWL